MAIPYIFFIVSLIQLQDDHFWNMMPNNLLSFKTYLNLHSAVIILIPGHFFKGAYV